MEKQSINNSIKKWLTTKAIINGFLWSALIIILVSSVAKTWLIRGLMQIGLFQPTISSQLNQSITDIILENSQQKTISLSALKGRVIFVNVWATWCPPCLAELPSINQLHKELAKNKNIVFLLVNADGDLNKSLEFMTNHQYDLPVFKAVVDMPAGMFGNSIPSTIIINKKGQIVFRHEGAADYTHPKFIDYLTKLSIDKQDE